MHEVTIQLGSLLAHLLCHLTLCLWIFWVTVLPSQPTNQPGTYRGLEGARCRLPVVLLGGDAVRSKPVYCPVFLSSGLSTARGEKHEIGESELGFKLRPFRVLGGSLGVLVPK